MASPIFSITLRAGILSIVSTVLAQFLAAYRSKTPFSLQWDPIIKFFVYSLINTPPNVIWQDALESWFPSSSAPETTDIDKKKEKTAPVAAAAAQQSESMRRPLIKTLIDQTAGAVVNTSMFCTFLAVWDVLLYGSLSSASSPASLFTAILACHRTDFVDMVVAGWKFWPLVSLGNFALVSDVSTRNLVGSLAGVAWGVYVSLFTGAAMSSKEE